MQLCLKFSRGEKLSDLPCGSFIHALIVHSLNKHPLLHMPYSTLPPQIDCLLSDMCLIDIIHKTMLSYHIQKI